MCGLCGAVESDRPADRAAVETMLDGLAHRGPDGRGVYDDDGPGELTLRTRVPVLVPADAGAVVLPAAAVRPAPALLLPNDGDFSYCKIRLDPVSRNAPA